MGVFEIDLVFRCGLQIAGFIVSIEFDLVSVGGRNWLVFSVKDRSFIHDLNRSGRQIQEQHSILSVTNDQKRSGVQIPPESYFRFF